MPFQQSFGNEPFDFTPWARLDNHHFLFAQVSKILLTTCVKIILIIYGWDGFLNLTWKCGEKKEKLNMRALKLMSTHSHKCPRRSPLDFCFADIYAVAGRAALKQDVDLIRKSLFMKYNQVKKPLLLFQSAGVQRNV